MKLSDRLARTGEVTGREKSPNKRSKPTSSGQRRDPQQELIARVQHILFERLGARLYDPKLERDDIERNVRTEITAIIHEEDLPLSASEVDHLSRLVLTNVLGYGPLQPFLDDPSVTEVMVTGEGPVWVEQGGKLMPTNAYFVSDDHHRRVIERIVSAVGRRVDESSPMVDARLPDGSRVNAIIPPLSVDGPSLSIRKFSKGLISADDLVRFGSLSAGAKEFLHACVRARINIIVSGGTGSGKTTLLNVLSSFIGDEERIVTIEDSVELQLQQGNLVRLESRPPNTEGKGQVTIRDLVINALRMRPDRIIVGECRGGESLDMLQAMNTGHEGSMTTLHANTPRDAIARLETMVLMAGFELPLRAIREQVAAATDLIVQIARLSDGTRKIINITEITGMEGDVVQLNDVFVFDRDAGVDTNGKFLGELTPTGIRPQFSDRFTQRGIEVPLSIFNAPAGREFA